MISDRISDDIPPQMKILNMVIPILMLLLQLPLKLKRCKPHNAACHQTICSDSISHDILSQIFEASQSEVVLQKQVHLKSSLNLSPPNHDF